MKLVGLACTGGGTKAVSNIGVIKALEELRIKISAISGTSIGSCIAVLYAMGYSVDEITEKMKYYVKAYPHLNFFDIFFSLFNFVFRGGVKNPRIINSTIRQSAMAKEKRYMSDLDIPVFIPALDITNKETVYFSSRNIEGEKCLLDRKIEEAVKSSCSLPILYLPNNIYIDGKLHQFLDGGMSNNTPSIHLKEFCDVVIGVENIYYKRTNNRKVNIITGIKNTFQGMRRSAVINQRNAADIWIQVDCKKVGVLGNKKDIDFCIEQGYKATMEYFENKKKLYV